MTALVPADAVPERVFSGGEWLEGPAWVGSRVRFSDIPNDRILEFDPSSGETSVYASAVEYVNGRAVDASGAVVQCSHGRRRVERDAGGTVTEVVSRWAGGRFNSPNDVVVASDGSIWFSDPPYGILPGGREGHPGEQEYDGCYVFRFDPVAGEAVPVITDMVHPNGLAFSPDESVLYVADTGFTIGGPAHIRAYDVVDGACRGGRLFRDMAGEPADGLRVDADGRIWTSAGTGMRILGPDGSELVHVALPETTSNLCFGDGYLYLTASTSLYRLPIGEG